MSAQVECPQCDGGREALSWAQCETCKGSRFVPRPPRRKVVELPSKPQAPTMADPSQALLERTLLALVWLARELLSDAELERTGLGSLRLDSIGEAVSYLQTSSKLTERLGAPDIGTMLTQATQAAKSAEAQVALHTIYLAGEDATVHRAEQQRPIARRSCEAAKKEAHRALFALLNTYPDAWEIDGE